MATITLLKEDHYTSGEYKGLPQKSDIIKYVSRKRYFLKVLNVDKSHPYSHTFKCKLVYNPAPKSRLRCKSIFSKFKSTLIN